MPKLKSDKELKAETLRELEGFKLWMRGSIEDGLYLMAARDELKINSQQAILTTLFYHLENGPNDVLDRIRKRYQELKQNGG